jgi:predicted PurR-regulated permease PerM
LDVLENSPTREQQEQTRSMFKWQVLITLSFTLASVFLVAFVFFAIDILLLLFAGVLVGIYLNLLKVLTAKHTRLPQGICLAVIILLLLSSAVLAFILLAPVIKEQAATVADELPKSVYKFRWYLLHFSWGDEVVKTADESEKLFWSNLNENWPDVFASIIGFFSTTFGVIGGFLFISVIGIYVGAEMDTYLKGILKLIPPAHRARGMAILLRLDYTLRWWLVGQTIAMLILASMVFLGLWLLNIPGALVLALFAALMTFVPTLGPVIAYIPTALIAFTISAPKLLYVSLFYVLVQSIEGFLITPLVHRRAITTPPALIISVQVLLFALIGFLGVLLSLPIVACIMVLVQMIYVEGILGDR